MSSQVRAYALMALEPEVGAALRCLGVMVLSDDDCAVELMTPFTALGDCGWLDRLDSANWRPTLADATRWQEEGNGVVWDLVEIDDPLPSHDVHQVADLLINDLLTTPGPVPGLEAVEAEAKIAGMGGAAELWAQEAR
ncbi:MAG TPA: hypothetical protein VKV25_08210 [Acidimicrobiales bacterium]|nr:hypothetical protein [Acidimicrobiales bacterium]